MKESPLMNRNDGTGTRRPGTPSTLGIPFSSGTIEYGRAYHICRKHRKPYREAQELEAAEDLRKIEVRISL
jgi:hypothetical protein